MTERGLGRGEGARLARRLRGLDYLITEKLIALADAARQLLYLR